MILEELEMQVAAMTEALAEHPARRLAKYANKQTGELPEVLGDGEGGRFRRRGDDLVTELGYADTEEARQSYQDYRDMTEDLKSLRQDLRGKRSDRKDIEEEIKKVQAESNEIILKIFGNDLTKCRNMLY